MVLSKEEARALFPASKWEELTREGFAVECNTWVYFKYGKNGHLYFKPKEQWPKTFEGNHEQIEVYEDGTLLYKDKHADVRVGFVTNLQLLYDAVEISKTQVEKNV